MPNVSCRLTHQRLLIAVLSGITAIVFGRCIGLGLGPAWAWVAPTQPSLARPRGWALQHASAMRCAARSDRSVCLGRKGADGQPHYHSAPSRRNVFCLPLGQIVRAVRRWLSTASASRPLR